MLNLLSPVGGCHALVKNSEEAHYLVVRVEQHHQVLSTRLFYYTGATLY